MVDRILCLTQTRRLPLQNLTTRDLFLTYCAEGLTWVGWYWSSIYLRSRKSMPYITHLMAHDHTKFNISCPCYGFGCPHTFLVMGLALIGSISVLKALFVSGRCWQRLGIDLKWFCLRFQCSTEVILCKWQSIRLARIVRLVLCIIRVFWNVGYLSLATLVSSKHHDWKEKENSGY